MTLGTPQLSESLLSMDAAAERLGVSRSTVKALVRAGRLPSIVIGRRRLFEIADLDAFIASCKA